MSNLVGQVEKTEPVVMRACASTYVAICGIWAVLLIGYVALALVKGANVLNGVAIIAAVLGLSVAWVRSFKIELSAEGIKYRWPFFRHASARWSDITSVASGASWQSGRSPFYMLISTRQGASPLVVNIKVFGRGQLSALAAAIQRQSPQARADRSTQLMSEGKMPSLFRVSSDEQ